MTRLAKLLGRKLQRSMRFQWEADPAWVREIAEQPPQISLTDLMATLRTEALRRKRCAKQLSTPMLKQDLCQLVRRPGFSREFWSVFRMALRSNPAESLTLIPTIWWSFLEGRLRRGQEARHLDGPCENWLSASSQIPKERRSSTYVGNL